MERAARHKSCGRIYPESRRFAKQSVGAKDLIAPFLGVGLIKYEGNL